MIVAMQFGFSNVFCFFPISSGLFSFPGMKATNALAVTQETHNFNTNSDRSLIKMPNYSPHINGTSSEYSLVHNTCTNVICYNFPVDRSFRGPIFFKYFFLFLFCTQFVFAIKSIDSTVLCWTAYFDGRRLKILNLASDFLSAKVLKWGRKLISITLPPFHRLIQWLYFG